MAHECTICLMTMATVDVTVLPCNHGFHAVCLGRHIVTTRQRGSASACPLCRVSIDPPTVFTNYLRCVRTGSLDDVDVCLKTIGHADRTNYWGITPLHVAASRGDLAIVTYLIYMGANVNARAKLEHTPLYLAAMHGHLNVVKYLVLRGANVLVGRQGKTPVMVAKEQRHVAVAMYLMEVGDGLR